MKIKAVIFDLDGTLIDSMKCWENVDNIFLLENGIIPPAGISDIMKKLSMKESADYFIKLGVKMHPDAINERIEQIVYNEYANLIPLKKYACQILDVLDHYKIPYCVATANYRSLTDVILKRHGIYDRFRFIYTCEENGVKKDEPSFFTDVSRLLGTYPECTAVLDDSFHCIRTSKNSGFFTVAVFDQTSTDWEQCCKWADMSVTDLYEFAEFINTMHQYI